MKKPLPETRLTHERIGSKVMRDDPAESREAPAAMTERDLVVLEWLFSAEDNRPDFTFADRDAALKKILAMVRSQVSGDSVSVPRSELETLRKSLRAAHWVPELVLVNSWLSSSLPSGEKPSHREVSEKDLANLHFLVSRINTSAALGGLEVVERRVDDANRALSILANYGGANLPDLGPLSRTSGEKRP